MSRNLALLLVLGAACLAASAAGAGEKVAPAATKAPAAAAKPPVVGNKQLEKKATEANKPVHKAKAAAEGPLANANCTAKLCIGGNCDDLSAIDWFNHHDVNREQTAHIPKILDNADGNAGLRLSGDPKALKWGVVFHDLNQLMAVTLKLTEYGKISLHYMLNSYMPKVSLSNAEIRLTCDAFRNIAGVRPDNNKHSFPTHIETEFDGDKGELVIEVSGMATHHCANFKASWYVAECDEGECCHIESGKYFDEHTRCSHSHNPCIKDSYCTGHHHMCPEDNFEEPETHCAWSGSGEDYYNVYAEGMKHTRMPAGTSVSVASTNAAIPSFEDMDECGGKCDGKGSCIMKPSEATCCTEVLKYGTQYGYGAISPYDKDSYGKGDGYSKGDGYGKGDDYGKGDGYGKEDDYGKGSGRKGEGRKGKFDFKGDYGKDGYDVYTAADKSGKANLQQANKQASDSDSEHHGIQMISCWEGDGYY